MSLQTACCCCCIVTLITLKCFFSRVNFQRGSRDRCKVTLVAFVRFSPTWVLIWFFKLIAVVVAWLHSLHSNSFSLEWIFICALSCICILFHHYDLSCHYSHFVRLTLTLNHTLEQNVSFHGPSHTIYSQTFLDIWSIDMVFHQYDSACDFSKVL